MAQGSDDFNRASLGSDWDQLWDQIPVITSNELDTDRTTGNDTYARQVGSNKPTTSVHFIKATLKELPNSGEGNDAGLAVRVGASGNDALMAVSKGSSFDYYEGDDPSTWSLEGSTTIPSLSIDDELRWISTSTGVEFFINDTSEYSTTTSKHSSNTHVGLGGYKNSSTGGHTRWDDAYFGDGDDYSDGDATATPATVALTVSLPSPAVSVPTNAGAGSWAQYSGSGQAIPGTSYADLDVGSTKDSDADDLISVSSGVYTPQVEGYYLVVAEGEFQITHNNRFNCEWALQKNGSGAIAGSMDAGYARDNSNEYHWTRASSITHFNGSTDTVRVRDVRDIGTGTPAGSYNSTRIKFVLLAEGATTATPFGHYGTPTSGAFSSSTYTDIAGWDEIAETDSTVIELQGDATSIRLKEANRPYLISYGLPTDASGGNRTQRVSQVTLNGTRVDHSAGFCYQRDSSNKYASPSGMALVRPTTANQDITIQLALDDTVQTHTWATVSAGSWTLTAAADRAGVMVIALPADTNIGIYENDTVTAISSAGPTDLSVFQTEVTEDSPFSATSNTALDVTSAVGVFAYGALMANRDTASGSRHTLATRWEIEGVDDAASEFGHYLRGDQSSQDCPNEAHGSTTVFDASVNDTLNFEKYTPASMNVGSNDDAVWGGAFVIDLDSLAVSGGGDATATPSTVALTTTIQAPTVSATSNATATPSTVALTTAIPAPTPSTTEDATAAPATVALTTAVPAPTASTTEDAAATPATVALTTTVPGPAVSTGSDVNVAPNTVALTTAIPGPTVDTAAGATATPAAVALAVGIPSPTVSTTEDASASPGVVALAVGVPSPTPSSGVSVDVTPATVALTTTVPSPTAFAGTSVDATPAAVALTTAIPAPTPSTSEDATATPSAVALTVSVPAPTAAAINSVEVTPSPVALTTAVPAPAIINTALVSADVVALVADIKLPTVSDTDRSFAQKQLLGGNIIPPTDPAARRALFDEDRKTDALDDRTTTAEADIDQAEADIDQAEADIVDLQTGYIFRQTLIIEQADSPYTFTKGDYSWLRGIKMRAAGAGGGGGSAAETSSSQASGGGGGGSGGYAEAFLTPTDIALLGTTESITIGAGGAGGTGGASVDSGDDGGDTTVFDFTCSGGDGGSGGLTSSTTFSSARGGDGGGVTEGEYGSAASTEGGYQFSIGGTRGWDWNGAPNERSMGGHGGTHPLGSPGDPGDAQSGFGSDGGDGHGWGAGGGGGANRKNQTSFSRDGGDGADGVVILELYA